MAKPDGVQVNSNAQIGKENSQTIGRSVTFKAPTTTDKLEQTGKQVIRSDRVEEVTVNEFPWWILLFLPIAWVPFELFYFFRSLKD